MEVYIESSAHFTEDFQNHYQQNEAFCNLLIIKRIETISKFYQSFENVISGIKIHDKKNYEKFEHLLKLLIILFIMKCYQSEMKLYCQIKYRKHHETVPKL